MTCLATNYNIVKKILYISVLKFEYFPIPKCNFKEIYIDQKWLQPTSSLKREEVVKNYIQCTSISFANGAKSLIGLSIPDKLPTGARAKKVLTFFPSSGLRLNPAKACSVPCE